MAASGALALGGLLWLRLGAHDDAHPERAERHAVAWIIGGASAVPVAADGSPMPDQAASLALPAIVAPMPAARVTSARALAELAILGGAPPAALARVRRIFIGPQGVTVLLRGGLTLYFGDALRPHAKWLAVLRVLADPSSVGARYLDVSVPDRPAAGFQSLLGASSTGLAAAQLGGQAAIDPLAQSLAAVLAGPGGSTTGSGGGAGSGGLAGGSAGSAGGGTTSSATGASGG